MRTLLLTWALIVGVFDPLTAAPTPAPLPYSPFCRTVWLFATPCAQISTTLVKQIKALSPVAGCKECNYKLVSATASTIVANHTSPDSLTSEKIVFKFNPTVLTAACRVSAQSQSLGFFSLLDNGLNYCNLYNLLSASGLNSQPGFMEMTNEWACLGYTLAPCKTQQRSESTSLI